MPISTSQTIVGAVIGAGIVKGINTVNKKTVIHIALGWVLTPATACLITFLAYRLISIL